MSSALRGLAPREGLELLLLKLGHIGPSMELRHGPQAGNSGNPRSQDANKYQMTPSSLKTRLFPRDHANGTVGLPKNILIKIP